MSQNSSQTQAQTQSPKQSMSPSLERINSLPESQFVQKFLRLSSSRRWVSEMLKGRPYKSDEHILSHAASVWWNVCDRQDWIEGFNGRPLIGDQVSFEKDLWCAAEDALTIAAPKHIADELIACNKPYTDKFGYVWILLCEGLTPEQQLWNYRRRIENDVETELRENCVEELKVTMRRLRLALADRDPYEHPAAGASPSPNSISHLVCEGVTRPLPLYSHATVHKGIVYVSGVQGFVPGTFEFPSEDPQVQARQLLQNLRSILVQAGSELAAVLKLTVFLIEMDDFPKVNAAIDECFPANPPARSTVEVSKLPRGARVVIEAIAAVSTAQ